MLHRRLLALALSLFFVSAPIVVVPAAFAASATQDAYEDTESLQEDEPEADEGDTSPVDDSSDTPSNDTVQASPSTTTGSTNLPFTGLEAGLIAAAGLGLAGTGFALRRAAREQD